MSEQQDDRPLRIGELADAVGTTPRTIRYYEEKGLLERADEREAGSHRLYDSDDVERLRDLLKLKNLLGVSLDELRELVTAQDARSALRKEWHAGVEDPVRRREILSEALEHVASQIELTRRRRKDVERMEKELVDRRATLHKRLRELEREGSKAYDEAG
ncbi:MerR family transcriptional regulator [soil metagenome]